MKSKLLCAAVVLAMVAGSALADTTAVAGSNAGANASSGSFSSSDGNSINANLSNGGSAGASASTGPSSASSSTGPVTVTTGPVTTGPTTVTTGPVTTGPTTATTGPVTTGAVTVTPTQSQQTGPMSNNLTIQGSAPTKIPVSVPGAIAPVVPSAQIFGGLNAPTTVAGIPLIMNYMDQCQPVATRANDLRDIYDEGVSRNTQIVFSPNQGYYDDRGNVNQEVESVTTVFPKQAAKYSCLGVITVMAKKDARGVPLTTIFSDARVYALREMEGFKDIQLLSVKDAIATALGVTTAGNGFSVSPGITSAAVNVLTLGALSGGYSNANGGTYSDASIGDTFLVLAPSADGSGVTIDPSLIQASYHPKQQPKLSAADEALMELKPDPSK